jgi:hypothetical protein
LLAHPHLKVELKVPNNQRQLHPKTSLSEREHRTSDHPILYSMPGFIFNAWFQIEIEQRSWCEHQERQLSSWPIALRGPTGRWVMAETLWLLGAPFGNGSAITPTLRLDSHL